MSSSWIFLSDDKIEDLKGNFDSLCLKIFVFQKFSAVGGKRVEGLCCVAVSQPETLHTVSNPVNHKISRE